jgi:two-component system invasion response regulator UvrY
MRILLAEGQLKARFALRVLLEQRKGLEVVGEAEDAQELLNQTKILNPDLILLAWGLPGVPTKELLISLRQNCARIYVVVLSERQEWRRLALEAGADAFVSKANPPEELLTTIDVYSSSLKVGVRTSNENIFAQKE